MGGGLAVFEHARDPYHRVDVRRSSRHVRVEVGGTVVAEADRPLLLVETGLPARWYIPRADGRFDLLTPTETRSTCPHEGVATTPARRSTARPRGRRPDLSRAVAECPRIEQAMCFVNEREAVTLSVDGEDVARPETHWSLTVEDR